MATEQKARHGIGVPAHVRRTLRQYRLAMPTSAQLEQLGRLFDAQDRIFRATGGVKRLGRTKFEVLDVLVSNPPTNGQIEQARHN